MKSFKTILIVEDHEESRFLYGEILRSESYEVIETEHGKEAIDELIKRDCPDLIIMDLTFPYMTAKEFVSAVRNLSHCLGVPFLIISGQHDIHEQAQDLGAAGYIKKPFDMDPFLDTIHKLSGKL